MPELNVYQQPEFPALYKWQAIAFMRMEWTSIFYDDNLYMSETYPPELQPIHFVMAEDDSLLSYASLRAMWMPRSSFAIHCWKVFIKPKAGPARKVPLAWGDPISTGSMNLRG